MLLLAWLVLILPVNGSDVARRPADISFASEPLWAFVSAHQLPGYLPAMPAVTGTPGAPTPTSGGTAVLTKDRALSPTPVNDSPASDKTAPTPGSPVARPSEDGPPQTPVAEPSAQPEPIATAAPTPVPRYTRGGIAFDAPGRLSLAYPVSFTGEEWVRFSNLEVLMADSRGETYRRFITEFNQQLYAYPETASNTFVLSVHDGTLSATGRELEAEPLRRLIEGSLHSPYDLATIAENLATLIGSRIEIGSADKVARFTVVQARRMSANDVAEYQYRPMELSLFMGPVSSPDTSFLVLICSGRQPDEPQRPFPGRFVFVLEEYTGPGSPADLGSRQSPN
ncbi:MAG: hypothetical protein ACYCYF_05665 [Anaerolineae bacterium]